MALSSQQREVIKRCQKSAIWFMRNFVKIKHPGAGIVPFNPFDYQQNAIRSFRKHRMNIFRKTRQCFTGDQMVWTPDGHKSIDSIRPGDRVWSRIIPVDNWTPDRWSLDPCYIEQFVPATVTEVYINPAAQLCRVVAGRHESITTLDHRYFTQYGEVEAGQLTTDHYLIGMNTDHLDECDMYRVERVDRIGGDSGQLYDLNVEQHHNYVVNGAVVHNCGISKVSGIFALWFALFSSHKTILIVSRKDDDAMSFLAENIKLPFSHLPEWMRELWKPVKDNEHELIFPNGSKIKSLTSHPDVLRSNASSLNIIDEAAFIQDMDAMWAAGRPCVRGDTLIQTDNGLIEISKLCTGAVGQFNDISTSVSTDDGFRVATAGYNSGPSDTKIIRTASGSEIECTPHHKLRVIDHTGDYVWRPAADLMPGSIIVTKPGTFSGAKQYLSDGRELTVEFAEILGLYVGDGTVYSNRPKRLKIHCDKQDADLCDYAVTSLNRMGFQSIAYKEMARTTVNCRINSAELIDLMKSSDLIAKNSPHDAVIPPSIMQSQQEICCAFLRGLFEADGTCYQTSTSFKIFFTSVSVKLATQVQVLLHSLGILTTKRTIKPGPGHFGKSDSYSVSVSDTDSKYKFRDLIGFISARKKVILASLAETQSLRKLAHPILIAEFAQAVKQAILAGDTTRKCTDKRLLNVYRLIRTGMIRLDVARSLTAEFNLSTRLSQYLQRGFAFDVVTDVFDGHCQTYDLSVPTNNTYLANGAISHNTLQHGGSVICISTTCGVGNWYWNTWTDAEAGANNFNPLMVNWWDMKWSIEYRDSLSGQMTKIAPTDGILPTAKGTFGIHPQYGQIELRPEIYGPYWSPWLEAQYRDLQEKGEAWKFEQEVLASFIGSGNTVLPKSVLIYTGNTVNDNYEIVTGPQLYVHPVSGNQEHIDFTPAEPGEGLLIWRKPVTATPDRIMGGRLLQAGRKAHSYVMGIDTATGKGRDWHGLEVFDIDEREQVAEGMFHCLPAVFKKIIDRVGRWYNTALTNIERNNGGDQIIDDLNTDFSYPRMWRQSQFNGKTVSVGQYGFFTSTASKPALNKCLLDYIRDQDGAGFRIYSRRLWKQMQIYVRKRDRAGRDTGKTEAEAGAGNHDDLIIATGLALIAAPDSYAADIGGVMPFTARELTSLPADMVKVQARQKELMEKGGVVMPMTYGGDDPELTAQEELAHFTAQLGGLPTLGAMRDRIAIVNRKKHQL